MSVPLDSILIDGEKLDARIDANLMTGDILQTMDGASTVTLDIHDPTGELLESGVLYRGAAVKTKAGLSAAPATALGTVQLSIAGQFFRLTGVTKTGTTISTEWENEIAAILRRHVRAKVSSRGDVTRAQFVKSLLPSSIPTLVTDIPGLTTKQKTEKPKREPDKLAAGAQITIKGTRADSAQLKNIQTSLRVAREVGAPELAILAMLVAGIGESNFRAVRNQGNPPSLFWGVYQGSIHTFAKDDTEGMARSFLLGGKGFQFGGAIKLARELGDGGSPGLIATKVEGSGKPASFYDVGDLQQQGGVAIGDEAKAILAAGGGVLNQTIQIRQQYLFRAGSLNGEKEDYWQAILRLADEVGWRAFVHGDTFTYASDTELFQNSASMMIAEQPTSPEVEIGVQYVGNIDFEWSYNQPVSEATIQDVPFDAITAVPGSLVDVVRCGPAAGRYLLWSIRQPIDSTDAEMTLRRPSPPKPEPAPQLISLTDLSGAALPNSAYGKAFAKAKQIDKLRQLYDYGGGHNAQFAPSDADGNGKVGYDCSGAVSAVLHAAGLTDVVLDTVALGRWGDAGRGETLTVWVKPYPGMTGHTFIEFTTSDGPQFFESGGIHGALTGFRGSTRSTAGFQPRHYRGM